VQSGSRSLVIFVWCLVSGGGQLVLETLGFECEHHYRWQAHSAAGTGLCVNPMHRVAGRPAV
jgi:hypothetical protein